MPTKSRITIVQPSDYRLIALPDGRTVKLDIVDYEWVSRFKWCADSGQYATNGTVRHEYGTRLMHRIILQKMIGRKLDKDEVSDHINNDRLDNRRANLRIATSQQNFFNRSPRQILNRSSPYKGVSWNKSFGKWMCAIQVKPHRMTIGHYTDELEAALAYDAAAIQLHGEFAWLNIL